MWCKCDECDYDDDDDDDEGEGVRDGIKVFGNNKYLCAKCGMVIQFG